MTNVILSEAEDLRPSPSPMLRGPEPPLPLLLLPMLPTEPLPQQFTQRRQRIRQEGRMASPLDREPDRSVHARELPLLQPPRLPLAELHPHHPARPFLDLIVHRHHVAADPHPGGE